MHVQQYMIHREGSKVLTNMEAAAAHLEEYLGPIACFMHVPCEH